MTIFELFGEDKQDLKLQRDLQENDKEFRIGLVMAGAISAGAYTAGVMDFMIEAIKAWENERGKENIPAHRVRFDALAGASAGGMCAGIFASALRDYKKGVTSLKPDKNSQNSFYKSWVIDVDIARMLELDDLKKGTMPGSMLNVTGEMGLEGIRDRALDVPANTNWPLWLKDPLPLILSVNNLRGIPFRTSFSGQVRASNHLMTMHADYVTFSLSAKDRRFRQSIPLDFTASGKVKNWVPLGETTLATGAFPVAFKPRMLTADALKYNDRLYSVPRANGTNDWRKIPPYWKKNKVPNPYDYWNVDGGTMNNEPFELARMALADVSGRNERDPKKASRFLLMVDPFPNNRPDVDGSKTHGELIGSVMRLLATWKNQARLKLEDADILVNQKSVSRFIIAPSKKGDNGPLASASLGAFGGLLDRTWRHHDYLLGRLNCQRFLMNYFIIDSDNRIIKNLPVQQFVGKKVRIIPLVAGMDKLEAAVKGINSASALPWPDKWNEDKLDDLHKKLYNRIKQVVHKTIDAMPDWGGPKKWGVKLYINIALSCGLKGSLKKTLEDNLRENNLY